MRALLCVAFSLGQLGLYPLNYQYRLCLVQEPKLTQLGIRRQLMRETNLINLHINYHVVYGWVLLSCVA